jgi:hypothetical protein
VIGTNAGEADLVLDGIAPTHASLRVTAAPAFPVTITPGNGIDVLLTFAPSTTSPVDKAFVFSGNASPFDSGRAYSKFQAYVLLEHNGDMGPAIDELKRQGYGREKPLVGLSDGCIKRIRWLNSPDSPTEEEQAEAEVPLAAFPTKCLETMPSVMREAFDYVVGTAIKPQPELTLGALIALFGAAFGRKVTDDYKTRTNVMILGLAPSGSGKEHPRQCNKEFLIGAGMDLVNAPERIGSSAGIISVVAHHPVRLFQLDEIGRMLATMRDPKISHLYNVGTVLMQMYSSSNTLWTGDAYADLNKIKQIDQPHVCVFGTSVSKSLYEGLSPENLTDGLVGRLLVFQSTGSPERRKPVRTGLPWRVTETLRYWSEYPLPGAGNLGQIETLRVLYTEVDADHRPDTAEFPHDVDREVVERAAIAEQVAAQHNRRQGAGMHGGDHRLGRLVEVEGLLHRPVAPGAGVRV